MDSTNAATKDPLHSLPFLVKLASETWINVPPHQLLREKKMVPPCTSDHGMCRVSPIKLVHKQLQSSNVNKSVHYCIHDQCQTSNWVTMVTQSKMDQPKTKPVTFFIPHLKCNFKILNLFKCQKPSTDSSLVITQLRANFSKGNSTRSSKVQFWHKQ